MIWEPIEESGANNLLKLLDLPSWALVLLLVLGVAVLAWALSERHYARRRLDLEELDALITTYTAEAAWFVEAEQKRQYARDLARRLENRGE